jgi:crotonobetainyl-CoA:carnitine CoA-transferase CaiB-like acyl-CoA transferase
VTGTDGHPAKPGIPLADVGTGMVAANSVLAALLARERTGAGTAISVGMFDVVTDWMSWALHQARKSGVDPVPLGVSSPMVSPYGAYDTADGHTIVIGTTNDAEFRRLAADVLGRPDLASDSRYAANADRVRLRAELDPVIAEWAGRTPFAAASAAAEAAGIGWARLNSPLDVVDHPELAIRDRWVTTPGAGYEFAGLRPAADSPDWSWEPGGVPALGEHTEAVRAEFAAG